MPHDADGFAVPADLTDPEQLAAKCESLSGGMLQQANASRQGSAMGGHPFPAQLYQDTSVTLKACAEMCKRLMPAKPPVVAPTPAKAVVPKG